MSKSTSMTRVGLLPVLLAMLGFSYSLATSNSDDAAGDSVGIRAVGTTIPLNFANPFVAGAGSDRDLGDAVAGSALTRLVRAKGGVPPYTFTAAGTAVQGIPSLATTLAAAQLQLFNSGILTTVGTQCSKAIPPGPFRFQVTVKDCFGTAPHTKTETFRLTFTSSNLFRFASTSLADGNALRPYSDVLAVINGKAPYTFAASNITFGSTTLTKLETIGLSLSNDGTLFGVPVGSALNGGTLKFTATATDANGKKASGRNGTGSSQQFTVNIGPGLSLSSVLTATSITVKAGVPGKDSVSYKGVADLDTESIAGLQGKPFSLRIGTYTAPSSSISFDGKGNAVTARGLLPAVKVSVKKFGALSATVKGDTISFGSFTGPTVDLAVEIRLGDAVIGSEILTFTVKSGRVGMTLTYKGGSSRDPGGAGQVVKVLGADDRAATGDAWKVAFIGRVPSGFTVTTITSATVNIGTSYSNNIALTNKNGKLTGKGSNKSPVISAFSVDTVKGKGSYTTGLLPKTSTGIPVAATATAATCYSTGITFMAGSTVGLTVESAIGIFPKKSKWGSQ